MKNHKHDKKDKDRKSNRMIIVSAKKDCGCCNVDMLFRSVESAERAFLAVGLAVGAEIVDDAGTPHDGIDTFYGFTRNGKNERGLKDLVGHLTGGIPGKRSGKRS